MISRRIIINLITFFVVSAALIALGLVNLLGDPFASPTVVTTELANADGLYPGFSVTLNGVQVGSVRSVSLNHSGAEVVMALRPGTHVPADVAARVDVANPLGEQQIDLVPQHRGSAPDLRSGARVPVAPGGAPADIGKVVATATRLLQAIPVGDLNTVLHQSAVALAGRARNVKTLIDAGAQFSKEFVAYQRQFRSLLSNAPPVLDSVTAAGPQLRDALANTATLLGVIATHEHAFVSLLHSGAATAQTLDGIVVKERPNLACLVHDVGALTANLSEPANSSNLVEALDTNAEFFRIVNELTPAGPARSLTADSPGNPHQVWLRTRLLLPPVLSPAAVTYRTPRTLPPVKPGAACQTEFGNGVSAASQPGFVPESKQVTVDRPDSADAQVRGSGTPLARHASPTSGPKPTSPDPARGPSGPAVPALGAAALALAGPVRRRWPTRRNGRTAG